MKTSYRCSHKLIQYNLKTSLGVPTSAYYQSSPTTSLDVFNKNDYMWHALRLGVTSIRGRSRAAATFKMECFVIIVNGFQPLTIITKRSILDVAVALDPPLGLITKCRKHFRMKVVFRKSFKIKTLLQVALYILIRPTVSNSETHHILNYWFSSFIK